MDNGFFSFINKVGDIIFLNLVFLLTCIPVITIGDALIALHTVTLKMAKGQEGYVVRGYLKAFKDNLKTGLLLGVVIEIILIILVYDCNVLMVSEESYATIGFMVTAIAIVVIIAIIQYLFPLLARYENKLKITLLNSALLAVSKLPYTIVLIVLMLIPGILVLITPYAWIYVVFAGIVVSALLQGKILNKIFDKIENN